MQIQLDAPAVPEHPETDGVFALKELLLRVDANIQVVKQQVVIGPIGPIGAAQDIAPRRPAGGDRGRQQ